MNNNHFIFKITLAFILSFSFKTIAQTDWIKWNKADYTYRINNLVEKRNYSFDFNNPGRFLLKSLANAYWFFISDVDGDNCSFNPTCSNFFILSVEKTNIVQGTLMFFDRFIRDMNIFGKVNHYPRVLNGHFYDPPSLYILDSDSINYIPPSVVVKNE
jgi:putative component of membrane protein insertase Oxa1/YidC/SpoIIIJ protein YidD